MVQIKQLQADLGFAIIFVTHDMSLVAHFSDRVAVMYAGQVVETRPTRALFADPLHPYTRGLLDSFPSIYGPRSLVQGIPGSPPDLTRLPPGCNFAARCPKAMPRCATDAPAQYEVDDALVRCLLYEETAPAHEPGDRPVTERAARD
jgi:peptide/nickel transport system ATP-binding protein